MTIGSYRGLLGVLLMSGMLLGHLAAAAERRVALVVGNGNYAELRTLPNPVNDARAIAASLKRLGFILIGADGEPIDGPLLDLEENNFALAVERFGRVADRAEIAFVYYAGHGMQFGNAPYLLPVDVPKTSLELVRRNAIRLEGLLRGLDSKADLTVAVFDACREIPELERAIRAATRSGGFGAEDFRGLARIRTEGRSRIIAYSGAAGQLVADGEGRHSPYTAMLLEHLEREGIEVGDVFRDVAYRFGQSARRQQPEVLIQGVPPSRFYLRPATAASPSVSAADQEIRTLLVTCETHFKAHRLTTGEGGTALECYREVLQREPHHAQALQGLNAIAERYLGWAEGKIANQRLERARTYLERAKQIAPEHPKVAELEERLGPRPLPEPAPTASGRKASKPKMVPIRGGEFWMGSPDSEQDRDSDERRHRVRVSDFRLGKHEVTRADFRRFVEASGYRTDAERDGGGKPGCFSQKATDDFGYVAGRSWRNPGFEQDDNEPVVCVSWNDAEAYIGWLNRTSGQQYRLPTEAEWEYAARAGTQTARFWGDDPKAACGYANVHDETSKRVNRYSWTHHACDDGVAQTARVGTYQPNPWGLYDMLGNVWEWTCSTYDDGYGGDVQRCATDSSGRRALRGGSWGGRPGGVRSAARYGVAPGGRHDDLGFRLAQDR